jgi:hypothetical protein
MAKTSNGERPNINKKLLNSLKNERIDAIKFINIQKAYWAGKNPWVTINNPNKEETNKAFIKVKANTLYGSPKERAKKFYKMNGE